MKIRERIARFMYGRYGFGYGSADKFNLFLIILYLITSVVNSFIKNSTVSLILSAVSFAICAYLIFRMFSKNIFKRQSENRKFVEIWGKVKGFFTINYRRIKEIRTNRYRRCPSCRAQLRLPKKKGKHSVICPACKKRFDVKIIL